MEMLLLFGLLILNFGISFWDGFVAGVVWKESRGWMKVVAVSAIIMSECGFISGLAIVFGFIAVSAHWINHAQFSALSNLTYLLIIFPILGSGFAITIHSVIEAYNRRDFASVGTATWNVFAMSDNIYNAADGGVSSAFSSVKDFFSSDDEDDSGKAIVILLLLFVIFCASLLTIAAFMMGRRHSLSVQNAERIARNQQKWYCSNENPSSNTLRN